MGDNDKNDGNKLKDNIVKENGLTYDDYAAIDNGNYYELVGGQLELMSPSPSAKHQLISVEILTKFKLSCESDFIILGAPIDVILSPSEVRQPDLVLINQKRTEILSNRGVEGSPDLVVEILSPSSLKRDKIDKLKTYANYQIPEYWIAEPTNGILEQYTLKDERYEIYNIYQNDDIVTSPNISCVSFTMTEIMNNIPDIRN